ncbi:DUF2254 domain-containing protein [Nocardioides ungokensis]|uniref:DUF2254 domain-containing protein n=1 Tax=Nocardioides ungokensis TaxID=1643322 RepID=UPI0015DEDBBA|nr:DUF2254 domain-containing protein [Nocardioides ungokensis]
MSWAGWFRIRQNLKESVWPMALLGAVLGPLVALLTRQADRNLDVPKSWQYAPSTATAVLSTTVGAAVGLAGFVVTVTVLAIQMATGTFSARYMRILYRDHLLNATLAVLAGTLTLSFSLLRQVDGTRVPNIGVSVVGLCLVSSLGCFLLFFGRFIRRLRPVAVAALVGQMAKRVITDVTRQAETDTVEPVLAPLGDPVLTVESPRDGAIQAVNVHRLVEWAGGHDLFLVMTAGVGDSVAAGQTVIAVHGKGHVPPQAGRRLQGLLAVGTERTIEEDPAFAIRIMVDVAVKALSAAINDPTTAVQAMDHLSNVLKLLGSTPLKGPLMFVDRDGAPRLALPGRTWEDYLTLGVTEIREYGASSIQVVRRLRAMLEDLQEAVLPEHRPAVAAELARLDATVASGFAGSVDKDRAQTGDPQGIGGPTAVHIASQGPPPTGDRAASEDAVRRW